MEKKGVIAYIMPLKLGPCELMFVNKMINTRE